MGRIQFLMDTSGHCFVCLKPTLPTGENNEGHLTRPRTFSFRNICDYLKINLWEVSKEAMPLNSGNVPTLLEKSDLKGVLCEECSPEFEGFSKYFLELEGVKMKLQYSLKSIYEKMLAIEKCEGKTTARFERELLLRKQTALRSGFVEQFRRKTIERCSTVIETGHPLLTSKAAEVFVEEAIHEIELGSENQIRQGGRRDQDDDVIFLSSVPASSSQKSTLENDDQPSSQTTQIPNSSTDSNKAETANIHDAQKIPVTISGKPVGRKPTGGSGCKQFKCKYCPRKFRISFVRNRHMHNCPGKVDSKTTGRNPNKVPGPVTTGFTRYKCFICNKIFPNEQEARQHGKGKDKLCPPCHARISQNAPKSRRKLAPPKRFGWEEQGHPTVPDTPQKTGTVIVTDFEVAKCSRRTQSPPDAPTGLNWSAAIRQNQRSKLNENTETSPGTGILEDSILPDGALPVLRDDEPLETVVEGCPSVIVKGKEEFPQTCKTCNQQFHSKRMMSRHLAKCNKAKITSTKGLRTQVQPPLQCQYCPKVFSSISNRNQHMRAACPNRKKSPEGSPTRKMPNERRSSQNEDLPPPNYFDDEMEADSWQIEVECAVCQEKVSEPATHKCTHLETTLKFNDQGDVVGEEVIPKLPLLTIPQPSPSTKVPPSSVNNDTGGTRCGVCSKEFPRKSVFLNHYTSSHLNSTFICNLNLCGREFYHRSDYTRHHRETHMGIKWKCDMPLCGKMFPQKERFLEHRQTVHFPQGYKLDMQSPPAPAPPPATVSNDDEDNQIEGGIPQSNLNPENGKHTCSLCPSEFQYKKRYEEHFKNFHLTNAGFKCKPCGREFSEGELVDFQRHVDKEHRGESFRCKICDKVFSHKSNLGAHRQSIHFGRKMDCPGCLRTFSSSANRRQHMRLNRCGKSRPSHMAYTKI